MFTGLSKNFTKKHSLIDCIAFGDLTFEKQHTLEGRDTEMIIVGLQQPARMLSERKTKAGYDLKFKAKIDSLSRNYLTIKFRRADSATIVSKVFIDGKQIGYNRTSD